MREPNTPKIETCALCGEAFEVTANRKVYCGSICKVAGEYVNPPEHAAMLESMSLAFIAALRIDPGYLIEIAAEGSRRAAREAGRRAA